MLVRNQATGEVLAGKILHESHRGDESARQRFTTEAEILCDLEHPNIVRVVGLHTIDREQVLLMERIEGDSLATLIAREAPMPQARLLALSSQLASGLAAAHHSGLIHRDLKPANVLVTGEGVTKIVDFGLARATSFEGVEASAFAVVGTPDYMAPDSIEPLSVDARSDIYALGCILFEMTVGRPPYSGATAFGLLAAHRDTPIPQLDPTPERSPELVGLVRWMLAKSPADRPQSAGVVADELNRLAQQSASASASQGPPTMAGSPSLALVPGAAGTVAGGRCAVCGQPLVVGVPVCFGCATQQPALEPGPMSLFVTGPGDLASKLDSRHRTDLLNWLRANPTLGLDPAPLAVRLPRLPFVLAIGISESSGQRLAQSLEGLGFTTEMRRGGRFSHRDMRRKSWRLGGRVAAIAGTSSAYLIFSLGSFVGPIALALVVGALGSGWHLAGRRVAKQRFLTGGLPPPLVERMERGCRRGPRHLRSTTSRQPEGRGAASPRIAGGAARTWIATVG